MKAIALFSGGLDSTLAMKLIIDQGIEVIALNVNMGFGSTKDRSDHMINMCEQVGATYQSVDIQSQFVQDILFDPKYGYGKNFNPCIDCHANMFRVAKNMMKELDASFLITGEVVGQRPMSQNKDALGKVLDLSQSDGYLLRPMSAKLLEETIPEKNGWVNRDKLLGIWGRNREAQIKMAEEINLQDYEKPGGGCLLTDQSFSEKLRDFVKYDTFTAKDIPVVKFGRHFRLPDGAKLVIGRSQEDNGHLEIIENENFYHIKTEVIPGPHSLLSKSASKEDTILATKMIITYAKTILEQKYTINIDGVLHSNTPLESKKEAQKYSIH